MMKYGNVNNYDVIGACISNDVQQLEEYYLSGYDLNKAKTYYGDYLIHLSILLGHHETFNALLDWGVDIEKPTHSEGASALNLAASYGEISFILPLVEHGADLNSVDYTDFTPLMNAIWFEQYPTANYLLTFEGVDVNYISDYGINSLMIAYMDQEWNTVSAIINHTTFNPTMNYLNIVGMGLDSLENYLLSTFDVDQDLVQNFEMIKLFGLRYDLGGEFVLISLDDGISSYSYEGFFNFAGIHSFYHAYQDYQSNVIDNAQLPNWGQSMYATVSESLALSASTVDPYVFLSQYNQGNPILITSGWDGHSIVFVMHGDRLYRCNRGELSIDDHGIEEYIIHNPENLDANMIEHMLDANGSPDYYQHEVTELLGLEKVGVVQTPMQTVGNCVWTSIEAGLEALMITTLLEQGFDSEQAHALAKQNFLVWEGYDMNTSLLEIINHSDFLIENNLYDELLFAALDAHHDATNPHDVAIGVTILDQLTQPEYVEVFHSSITDLVFQYDHYAHIQTDYMMDYESQLGYFDAIFNPIGYYSWGMSSQDYELAKEYHDFLVACSQFDSLDQDYSLALEDIFADYQQDLFMSTSLTPSFNSIESYPLSMPMIGDEFLSEPVLI